MSKNQDILEGLVVECCEALFAHYGVDLTFAPDTSRAEVWDEDLALAGIIGFTADELRGSLVLAMGRAPLEAVDAEAARHRDWIQELSNQLLGRVKNRLLGYGVDLKMTTPLSMRGVRLTLEGSSEDSAPLLFRTAAGGAVCVMVDEEVKPGFEFEKAEGAEDACPEEGELLLF
jgi:CheY-specific phosphatase CheX